MRRIDRRAERDLCRVALLPKPPAPRRGEQMRQRDSRKAGGRLREKSATIEQRRPDVRQDGRALAAASGHRSTSHQGMNRNSFALNKARHSAVKPILRDQPLCGRASVQLRREAGQKPSSKARRTCDAAAVPRFASARSAIISDCCSSESAVEQIRVPARPSSIACGAVRSGRRRDNRRRRTRHPAPSAPWTCRPSAAIRRDRNLPSADRRGRNWCSA